MDSKRIASALVGVVAAVVVGVGITLALTRTPSVAIKQKLNVGPYLLASAAYGNDTMLTTNWDSLISYNYKTGAVQTLSPNTGHEGLRHTDTLGVSADKKHFLFHNGLAPAGTMLATKLASLGWNTDSDYWWIFNADDQTFVPLPPTVLMAKIDGNQVHGLAFDEDGAYIKTFDTADGKQTASISISPSSNFFATKDGFLLQLNGGDIVVTKDGIVNTQLFKKMTLVGVSADKQWAVISQTKADNVMLSAVNLENNSTKTIASNVVGTPALFGNQVLYGTNDNQTSQDSRMSVHNYDLSLHKKINWSIAESVVPLSSKNTTYSFTAYVGTNAAVLNDTAGNYLLLGNNLRRPAIPPAPTQ